MIKELQKKNLVRSILQKRGMLAYLLYITTIIFLVGEVKNIYAEPHHIQKRIVLGNYLDIKNAPWEVSLHKRTRPEWQTFICGGAIIGPNEILTAGHCVGNASSFDFFIRAGSGSRYIGGSVHNVEEIQIYPGYHADTCKIQHDVAFLRVKQPLKFSEYIQPVKLGKRDPRNGEFVTIAGWGKINPYYEKFPSYSDQLKFIQISAWHKTVCYKKFGIHDILVYEKDMICISNMKKGTFEAICDGDSGSPVLKNNKLVGVVSAYISDRIQLPPDRLCGPLTEKELKLMSCNGPNTVGLYNSIVPHRSWIYKLLIKSREKIKDGYFCLDGCF